MEKLHPQFIRDEQLMPAEAWQGSAEFGLDDLVWLAPLIGDKERAAQLLPELQMLEEVGSERITPQSVDYLTQKVMHARVSFLLALGISHETLDELEAATSRAAYVDRTINFVRVQRFMWLNNLPGQQLLSMAGHINKPVDWWEQQYGLQAAPVLESLMPVPNQTRQPRNRLGTNRGLPATLDMERVIQRHPELGRYSDERLKARVDDLLSLGLSVRTIQRQPSLLGFTKEGVVARLQDIADLGIPALRTVNRCPGILTLSLSNLQSKIETLERFGVDTLQAIENHPAILTLSVENIERKVRMFQLCAQTLGWNGNISQYLSHETYVMSMSPERLWLLIRAAGLGASPDRRNSWKASEIANYCRLPLEYIMLTLVQLDLSKITRHNDIMVRSKQLHNNRGVSDLSHSQKRETGVRLANHYDKRLRKIGKAYLQHLDSAA